MSKRCGQASPPTREVARTRVRDCRERERVQVSGANLQLWGINRHERGGKSLARRVLAGELAAGLDDLQGVNGHQRLTAQQLQ